MPTITIRNLDSDIKDKLKIMAAHHNRSMEAEVRSLLKNSVMAQYNKPPLMFWFNRTGHINERQ